MKKIRKILPLSIYDIPGIERWLEEQANNGLFPSFIDAWVTFTPNAVPGTRFRLEPYGKTGTEPTEEQLMLYREAGWEYAFAAGKVYFLFYTTDPEAVELYSDHESHGLSIERLEQRVQKYHRVRRVIYAFLAVGLVWAVFFHQSNVSQRNSYCRRVFRKFSTFNHVFKNNFSVKRTSKISTVKYKCKSTLNVSHIDVLLTKQKPHGIFSTRLTWQTICYHYYIIAQNALFFNMFDTIYK